MTRLLLIAATSVLLLANAGTASALTVAEVAKDLACPCQCPLIVKDCNMSCGITWKKEIGELIKKGMTKQEIMDYFISSYGESARLNTSQKLDGKIYQYTRSFDTMDWTILWSAVVSWMLILFIGIFIAVRRFFPSADALPSGDSH